MPAPRPPLAPATAFCPALGSGNRRQMAGGYLVGISLSGRWYLDRDHVFGFSPLLPFRLDTQCGDQFIGNGSYLTMEAAWLALAAVVWFVAFKFVQKPVNYFPV